MMLCFPAHHQAAYSRHQVLTFILFGTLWEVNGRGFFLPSVLQTSEQALRYSFNVVFVPPWTRG